MVATSSPPLSPAMLSFWTALIVVGIGLKIGLLCTSQSMPDGDEAIEGLMAMHILSDGTHPIYPYGVNYGAGAGWEAHVAALLFALFGVSEIALKSVGLIHYLATLGLVAALAFYWRGREGALMAAGLFAIAPQTAQWALKCAGGHQVAVVLALAGWLCVLRGWAIAAVILLPLAVLAHPVVLPFAAVVSVGLLLQKCSRRQRAIRFAGLALAAAVEFLLLRPPSETVWNPSSKSFDFAAKIFAVPRLALGLFSPNLNSLSWVDGWQLAVAALWLVAVLWSLRQRSQPWWNRAAWLAGWGVILMVSSGELAPRHVLIASPVAAIVLACGIRNSNFQSRILPAALALSGAVVNFTEMSNPCIYGPGGQSRGVDRQNFASVMHDLQRQNITAVYCIDPMLQWNIVFASREQILARWRLAHDRVPRYITAVDEARANGKQVALVVSDNSVVPPQFAVVPTPPDKVINDYFQPSRVTEQRWNSR